MVGQAAMFAAPDLDIEMPEAHRALIVGLGRQMMKDHVPAILARPDVEIVALVDPEKALRTRTSTELLAPAFPTVELALKNSDPTFAIVSVPHTQYRSILPTLAANRIPTLKEKPIGISLPEASDICAMYDATRTRLQVCVQRRFSPLYSTCKNLLRRIGNVYSVYAESTLNLSNLDSTTLGWRADRKLAGGGAALDLGYHTIDLLTYLFGIPDRLYAQLNYSSLPGDYTIDDSVKAMLAYGTVNANFLVTEIFYKRVERYRVFGTDGFLWIDDRMVSLLDRTSQIVESHAFHIKQQEVVAQLDHFIANLSIPDGELPSEDFLLRDQMINIRIIDALYRSHETQSVIQFGGDIERGA